jgi:hypothetical protein
MSDEQLPMLPKSDADTLRFALLQHGVTGEKHERMMESLKKAGLRMTYPGPRIAIQKNGKNVPPTR